MDVMEPSMMKDYECNIKPSREKAMQEQENTQRCRPLSKRGRKSLARFKSVLEALIEKNGETTL
jgi:hypothetical protein